MEIDGVNVQIEYDEVADVLYISFGDSRPAISSELGDGEFIRVNPFTNKIVGLTIMDFKERYVSLPSVRLQEGTK